MLSTISTASQLEDRFGRRLNYLRVSLIEHCNLRCIYCMPAEGLPFRALNELLTEGEVLRIIRVAATLGCRKVRFTGGEPGIRKDLVSIVARTVALAGVESVHLTTNGLLISPLLLDLRRAGLTGLNVSLDTLRAERYREVTRRDGVEQVLANIERAVAIGFPSVKVNVVALRGRTESELSDFVDLTRKLPITVRFIELMPFDAAQLWKKGHYLGSQRLVTTLRRLHPALEVAEGSSTEQTCLRLPGFAGSVAVIPAYSRSLCGSCNRLRVTADGQLSSCLYSKREFDLRGPLRRGATDQALAEVFRAAARSKLADGWAAQREGLARQRTSMAQVGG